VSAIPKRTRAYAAPRSGFSGRIESFLLWGRRNGAAQAALQPRGERHFLVKALISFNNAGLSANVMENCAQIA